MTIKTKLLAGAVALIAFDYAHAANVYNTDDTSLVLGGRVQANFNSVEATADHDKAALETKARLRVDGSTKIYDGVKAIGFAEWEVGSETSQNGKWNTRFAYTGFKTDNYGTLTFGQDHTGIYYVIDRTDVFTDYGSRGNTYWSYGGRQEGQIKYNYTNGGLVFNATYQSAGLDAVNNGAATSVGYTFDVGLPLVAALGYDFYDVADSTDDKQSVAAGLSLGTEGDGFYSGLLYQFTDYKDSKNKNGWEALASYGWESGWVLYAGYQNLRQGHAILKSNLIGELQYNFNSNFKVLLETEIGVTDIDRVDVLGNKISSTGERSDDKVSIAAQYNF
ncbi:porin [uncultured Ruminobacter sp.]|uniref:porin n=1 Tax=uncultured Ruminobacter sp. TaxID=538947 RepID=UPI0025E3B1F2|nr:porin [uncultured Ruminobacter sp.]